eukprot:Nitzschia sp. Nitz4//scaffold41_size133979//56708//57247//NITZ4_003346-RA/size133979-processed-gene-0.248-mRNA-1//-1//CDS//3329551467//1089//frame0
MDSSARKVQEIVEHAAGKWLFETDTSHTNNGISQVKEETSDRTMNSLDFQHDRIGRLSKEDELMMSKPRSDSISDSSVSQPTKTVVDAPPTPTKEPLYAEENMKKIALPKPFQL